MIFFTCKVGNATDFLRKMANDWDVVLGAYQKRVACSDHIYSFPGKPSVTT